MEFSTQEPARKQSASGTRWTGVAVFAIAVAAVLFYASSQEHDMLTLAALCGVLLVGEILAVYQWYTESKRAAADDAAPRLIAAFDERMKHSFANQEIIHKEVHANFEALSKQIAALENALKYLANLQEQNQKIHTGTGVLSDSAIARIAQAVAAQNTGTDRTEELADAIEKLRESVAELSKDFSEQLNEQSDAIQARISTQTAHVNLDGVNEQLEAIAAAQDELIEKFELLQEDDTEAVADEIFLSETDEDAGESDEAFPLPENMFERAQNANAASVASAVSKLISDVPEKQEAESETEADAEPAEETESLPESQTKPEPEVSDEAAIEIEETPAPDAQAEASEPGTPDASEEPKAEPEIPAQEHRPVPEGELPLIEDLPHTALILKAAFGVGERPYLRGNAPGLSKKKSIPMDYAGSNLWRFDFGPMQADAEITIFRNDTNEALGEPFKLRAGKVTTLAFSPNA